jgi:hypothetical protein
MRYSTKQFYPGYKAWMELSRSGKHIKVYLDDEEIKFCETVDEERGLVVIVNFDDGEVTRTTRRGRVKVEIVDTVKS